MTVRISPSIAAGNVLDFASEIKRLEASGADMIHVDAMDGHFVPLLTFGVPFVAEMRKVTKLHLDVHIMVTNPDAVFEQYLEAGADTLVFHPEAALHSHRICQRIRQAGKRAGVALNPGTPWESIRFLLPVLDQVTIMTVNPGYSRQAHLLEVHPKISELAQYCRINCSHVEIQVDGGVSAGNAALLARLGARNLVAGGAVMGKPDYAEAIDAIRKAAESGCT